MLPIHPCKVSISAHSQGTDTCGHVCAFAGVCRCVRLPVLCMHKKSARLMRVSDLKSLSQRGLNHLSSHGLPRAVSSLSYQSIDVAPTLPVALGGRCCGRPWPHHGGILMGMQIAFGLATSADIDPPADFYGGDRWTVTSEWEKTGTPPLTSSPVGFSQCLCSVRLCARCFVCPFLLLLCPHLISSLLFSFLQA